VDRRRTRMCAVTTRLPGVAMKPKCVAVAGLGLLGRGIAACLLAHEIPVIAYTPALEEVEIARKVIATAIEELIALAGFPSHLNDTWQPQFTVVDSPLPLGEADFIIESIIESPEAKAALYDALESVAAPATPIASNTSAIPISLLQRHRKHPERFVGMHWAEPAHATRFLELIRGEHTNQATLDAASSLARLLGKDPCIVQRDLPGFIANRLGYAVYREACYLLETGIADAETIDRSFRNSFGLWASVCGPFRWIDLTGGPALYARAMEPVLPTLSNASEIPPPLAALRDRSATGIRSGEGFFHYTEKEVHAWEEIYRRNVWIVRNSIQEALLHLQDEVR